MWGEHRERRSENRKFKRMKEEAGFRKANQQADQTNAAQDFKNTQRESMEAAQPGLDAQREKRQQYIQDSVNEVNTPVQGLTDLQRRQLQESASNQINKDTQNYSRQLASSAGKRGVRGGSAAAQQMALQEKGLDAQRQFNRDLAEKDIDVAMQKLAAVLTATQGREAQDLGAQSEAKDYIEAQKEKKRQQALAQLYNKQYLDR